MNCATNSVSPNSPLLLGIDGGGSKTVAWLGYIRDGRWVLHGAGQGGPSNPRAVGFETAFHNIQQTVHLAFKHAGLAHVQVDVACLCVAGTGRLLEMEAILKWAEQSELSKETLLVSEAEAVLAGAASQRNSTRTSTRSEVSLICGTGSLAWGRSSPHSSPIRSGGWGYLLGDEGGGYWLGQSLLQLACKTSDGRAAEDALLDLVLSKLQLNSAENLVGWCYELPNSRERIASLAPVAFQCSTSAPVRETIDRGARELAIMVNSVVGRLNCPEYDLALAGSVVVHQPDYRNLIIKHLNELECTPASFCLVEHPVGGTLQLAFEKYKSTIS